MSEEAREVSESLFEAVRSLEGIEAGISDVDVRDNFYCDVIVPFEDIVASWNESMGG